MVCWACKFNKLSNNTSFPFFWNYLGPQINSLLQVLNRKQKNKTEKDWKEKEKKIPGGYLETLFNFPAPHVIGSAFWKSCTCTFI